LEKKEVRRILEGLKDGKALGVDGMPNEVEIWWIEEWVWEVCNRVWKGEGWPEKWKEEIISIVKKGQS